MLMAPADKSLHNLLTKWLVTKKKYSQHAIETFKKLVEMSGLPVYGKHSKKHKMLGEVVQSFLPYHHPDYLVDRLQLLVASISAGNIGSNNEIFAILDESLWTKAISKDMAIQLNRNLLLS